MQSSYNILIVDDNPTNLAILNGSLSKAGHEVHAAPDGETGISLAVELLPDIILLDLRLPDRDGLEVCKILKADPRTASIPIIFVTAVTSQQQMLRAFEAGGCDYVTKPYRTPEVLARVSVHVRLRRAEEAILEKHHRTEELAMELADANIRLAKVNRTDPLTDLLNRRAWEEAAILEHERFTRSGLPYSVIMMDVDHFKRYNDTQGHQAGDECLRKIAQAVTSTCRRVDQIGRYGGEEFVVLVPGAKVDAALQLAERIRQDIVALKIPHPASPTNDFVTVSLGVASTSPVSWEETLQHADESLYIAKGSGRNMVYLAPASDKQQSGKHSDHLIMRSKVRDDHDDTVSILVVDDDIDSRRLCRKYLEGDGYRVLEAENGQQALTLITKEPPDVIIMDVVMPILDGLECTRRVRELPSGDGIPIIVLSARSDREDILAGLQAGADEYLTKPFVREELLLRVRSMVRVQKERMELLRSFEKRGEQTRVLRYLLESSQRIIAATEAGEILSHAIEVAALLMECKRISIMLPDQTREFLYIASAIGIDPQVQTETRIPVGEMVSGKVFATGRPVVICSEAESPMAPNRYESSIFASVPLVSTPVVARSKVLGVLNLTDRADGRPFDRQELEYLRLIAGMAGAALQNMYSRTAVDRLYDATGQALTKV